MTRLEAKAYRARRAIAAQTTALEEHLWRGIRAIPGEGVHFRRQVVIGPYLTDFVSHRLRLVIEVDGAQHARPDQQAKDAARDRWLGERGYDVHLREADDELGGSVRYIQQLPGLAEWGRITSYRQTQLDKLKSVEVHTGVGAMSADDVLSYGADRVVIAAGSHWAPNGLNGITHAAIAGADSALPQICTPDQVMNGKDVGERVVVLDADG